ncbi:MAG: DNA polymerase III subunit alpha [Bacteroidales bacterium]|nr:DNA polymerase III subunit alpha [Bacteroidales bacterium]
MPEFTHLHVHTQFSILDGASKINALIEKAAATGMKSLAITDHGNMFGVPLFIQAARNKGIKPIVGCEVYVAAESRHNKAGKQDRKSYHLILLAKNKAGYHNLAKLSSKGYLEGFYYNPRIDKELLREYHEGIIASSACLGGEIPSAIMNHGIERAELALQEYLDIFGEDFYLELQDHGLPEQKSVNKVLIELAAKYNVKLIATNDVHFINENDFQAHRILICLNTGKDLDDVSGMHYTGQEFLKTPEQMLELFGEHPEALSNTAGIVAKVEDYEITTKKIVLPHFPLPEGFESEDDYLRHLAYEGAQKLYPELSNEISERLDFELKVIREMGFPGYFLIVQDFIAEARKMKVIVGPGRGSAAGSAVAYCTGITNIDPIRYNLLFERFLNPERVTMPDIDVDFDDEGREKVLDYVVKKYGRDKVAQIVTFGTMAARSAIRDVARVLKLPLPDADRLAKLIPEKPGITFAQAYREVPELAEVKKKGKELEKKTLTLAETLEGSARHTGTHACGVIIGPDDLVEHVPLSTAKDSTLMVTQYEGKLVESVGMLKMDFLGLKTLSIIKDALRNIRSSYDADIDIDNIPLDDELTFQLYQKGETIGTFQFESEGMRKHLKELKPNNIEDLIAMNALYRPGPMQFIEVYINRKQGREKVNYPHPMLEEILKPTYGIMVYQEQIMQTAQLMAGFSLGKADILRRAMGKKKAGIMQEQKIEFVKGALAKNIEKEKAEEIFGTMERFAEYGFNRSHSAAYSVIAYQTAYLKAHYTAEYMAAVLTHNLNDIKKITFFIDESKRQNIEVLGPDVNESEYNFTVTRKGTIRFGMGAIKGVGESAVKAIVQEREANGPFLSIFDMAKRVSLQAVNKSCFEALAKAGAFDNFEGTHRAQFFYRQNSDDSIFLEKVIRHGSSYQEKKNSAQQSLFGDDSLAEAPDPEMPDCNPYSKIEQLRKEKEVTGFYISGHPLDDFAFEIENFCDVTIGEVFNNIGKYAGRQLTLAGMITEASERLTQNGNYFGTFILEDFNDSKKFFLFSEDYLRLKHFLIDGTNVLVNVKVQFRRGGQEQLEIKVNGMSLLAEAIAKYTKTITISLKAKDITAALTGKLRKMLKNKKGNCQIKFRIEEDDSRKALHMQPRKQGVDPAAFIRELREMPDIEFKIN